MYTDQETPEILDFNTDGYAEEEFPGPIDQWELEDFQDMICSAE